MAKFASLFASHAEAENAARALKQSKIGDAVQARVVNEDEWSKNWSDLEENDQGEPVPETVDPDFNVWLHEEAIHYYSEGLKQGGAVLVVEVPGDLSREAEKIVKDNKGKIA